MKRLFLALAALTAPLDYAWAEPQAGSGTSPAPPGVPLSAVSDVVKKVDESIGVLIGKTLVAVAPVQADADLLRGDELSLLLGKLTAGRRALQAPPRPETLEAAVARGRGFDQLLLLTPRLQGGRLLLSADVHPLPKTVWARLRNPNPGATLHAFAEAPFDAEVRSFLKPLPLLESVAMVRAQAFESGVLALACADLDRDGAPEIVTLSGVGVGLVRVRGGKAVPIQHRRFSELSERDATPLREAIGTLVVPRLAPPDLSAPRHVTVSSTDRKDSVVLDGRLRTVRAFRSFALSDGEQTVCARFDAPTLTGPLEACDASGPQPARFSVGGRYDAYVATAMVSPQGKTSRVWAGREDQHLELFDDQGASFRGPRVGAQLALADLDQDGEPEVISSLDSRRGEADAVVISSWLRAEKKLVERLRMPVAAGVQALAVCSPDSAGRPAIVIATPAEVWVAR